MDADLERLIRLQQIDLAAEAARKRIADHPTLVQSLDARLSSATEALDAAKAKVAENQAGRRAIEKDLATIQARLSKFKDQLMEVKTNKEYTAMLKEIEAAQNEVRRLEDLILERMLEHDDLAARQKAAESRLSADKAAVAAERTTVEAETVSARARARGDDFGPRPRGGRRVGDRAVDLRNRARAARHGGRGDQGGLLQRLPRPDSAPGCQ